MDFLKSFLDKLGMQQQPVNEQAEREAIALRRNGAPSQGVFGQNYAGYLGSRAASGSPFSALSAQALFNHAQDEQDAINLASQQQLQLASRNAELDYLKSIVPSWLNNINNTERFGVRPDVGSAVQIDPVINTIGRTTMQDEAEADILKKKTDVITALRNFGVVLSPEAIESLLRSPTETTDQMDDAGNPVFPKKVGQVLPDGKSPTNETALEVARTNAAATVQAARERAAASAAMDRDAPIITIEVSPDGKIVRNLAVKGKDPNRVADTLSAAKDTMGRSTGMAGPAPAGTGTAALPAPVAYRVIDKARVKRLIPEGIRTTTHQVFDSGDNYIFVDSLKPQQQLVIPKAAVE